MKKIALFIALISTGFSQDFLNPLMNLPAEDFFNPEKRSSVRQTFLSAYRDWLTGHHHSHQKNEEHFGDKVSRPLKFILQLGRYTSTLKLEETQLPNLARAITFAVAGHVWPIKSTTLQDDVRLEYVAAVMNACNIIDIKTDDVTHLANSNPNITQEPAHFDAFSRIIAKTSEHKEKATQNASPQERDTLIEALKAHWRYEQATYDREWIDKAIEEVYMVYTDHIRDHSGLNPEIFGGLKLEESQSIILPANKKVLYVIPHEEGSHRNSEKTASRVESAAHAPQASAKEEASAASPRSKPEPSSPAAKNKLEGSQKRSPRGGPHKAQAVTQPRVAATMFSPKESNKQVAGQESKKATK